MSSVDGVLRGKRAAFLVENGVCERELVQAQNALNGVGVDCRLVSTGAQLVKSWNELKDKSGSHWGADYAVHHVIQKTLPSSYDILVIPGGKRSVEKLKLAPELKSFMSAFIQTGKPSIVYNSAIELLMYTNLVEGYSIAAKDNFCEIVGGFGGRCASPEFVVSKNLVTLSRFRDIEDKLQNAVLAITDGKPYVEKTVSSQSLPQSHKAA